MQSVSLDAVSVTPDCVPLVVGHARQSKCSLGTSRARRRPHARIVTVQTAESFTRPGRTDRSRAERGVTLPVGAPSADRARALGSLGDHATVGSNAPDSDRVPASSVLQRQLGPLAQACQFGGSGRGACTSPVIALASMLPRPLRDLVRSSQLARAAWCGWPTVRRCEHAIENTLEIALGGSSTLLANRRLRSEQVLRSAGCA